LLDQANYESVIVLLTKHGADRVAHLLAAAITPWRCCTQSHPASGTALPDFAKDAKPWSPRTSRRGLTSRTSSRINYDVPQHPEDYIHRIGCTGRAEAKGDAFTLMVAAIRNTSRPSNVLSARKFPG
jgi:ATP-dependent RNA helicase RhlE